MRGGIERQITAANNTGEVGIDAAREIDLNEGHIAGHRLGLVRNDWRGVLDQLTLRVEVERLELELAIDGLGVLGGDLYTVGLEGVEDRVVDGQVRGGASSVDIGVHGGHRCGVASGDSLALLGEGIANIHRQADHRHDDHDHETDQGERLTTSAGRESPTPVLLLHTTHWESSIGYGLD